MQALNNLLTAQTVADKLKVSPQYVRRLISTGKLHGTRIGSQWLIDSDNIVAYLK